MVEKGSKTNGIKNNRERVEKKYGKNQSNMRLRYNVL